MLNAERDLSMTRSPAMNRYTLRPIPNSRIDTIHNAENTVKHLEDLKQLAQIAQLAQLAHLAHPDEGWGKNSLSTVESILKGP